MKPISLLCFVLSALPAFAQSQDSSVHYQGIKVLRIPTGSNILKLEALVTNYQLNVWTEHALPNSHLDVEVPPEKYTSFTTAVDSILKADGITTSIVTMHDDLEESIRKESEGNLSASDLLAQEGAVAVPKWFDSYHTYADHLTFLDDLVAKFPKNAKIVSAGQSFEGRDIKGIHIFGSSGPGHKPAVVWHGTAHAREWIATMVTEYLAYSLLSQHGDSILQGYVEKYDFYIFPVVNPDGFVYTQTTNRLWRKNRQTPPAGSTCYGIDINRNWDIQWSSPGGASTDPCAEDYKGQAPTEAPETRAIASFIDNLAQSPPGVKMYTDWHSYSQLFMFPYGYDCSKIAEDNTELSLLSTGFSIAVLSVHGTYFQTGPICQTIYPATGGSTDYVYDVSKVKYSFASELRDVGQNGFLLPPDQIRPSGEEIWAGVKYLLAKIH